MGLSFLALEGQLAMRFFSYQLSIRPPHPYWALGIVVLWSISLCVVDTAAMLEVRRSMVLVKAREHCDRYRPPSPDEVLTQLVPGDRLRVRQLPARGKGECYGLEDAQGRRGWAPYNSAYLASDGINVRWRRLWTRDSSSLAR